MEYLPLVAWQDIIAYGQFAHKNILWCFRCSGKHFMFSYGSCFHAGCRDNFLLSFQVTALGMHGVRHP